MIKKNVVFYTNVWRQKKNIICKAYDEKLKSNTKCGCETDFSKPWL